MKENTHAQAQDHARLSTGDETVAAPTTSAPAAPPLVAPSASAPKSPRPDSKMAALVAALREPDGATIPRMRAITGWQEHSVRGALAGALKRKFGLTIASAKEEGRGRVYRAAAPDAAPDAGA